MKKQVQVLKVMAFAVLAGTASATLPAAMLDLAGTDMTVSDVTTLASYDGVTNSSATAATLTFNIADDQTYDMTIGGKVAVVKAGAGTLSLGKADRTFTGGTTVSQGKLVLATDNAKALGTGTVTVADGATLDFNGAFSTAHGAISSVYAAGTGVDGNGALVNTGAAHVNKYLTSSGALYLTGDLLFNPSNRLDIGNIYPQGHTFRLKGTGANSQTARVNKYYNPNGGDISIEHGTYLAYEATSFGNTADKSTIYLRGGVLSVWVDGDSYYDKSPLVVEQASTIQGLARNDNRSIFFGKPVTLNAPLTFSRSSGTYLATIGFNNNDNALYGSAPITVGANVRFAYAIAYTSSKNKYSGPIIVNASGTLCIGSGKRGALTSSVVTNNGTVAYNCTKDVTVSPREIIGGAFTLPTDLTPADGAASVTLTVNGTVLSNMTTTIYRNALTLDGGAKVVGGKINLPQSEGYAGTLTLKNCLVTNLADIAYVYRGVMTLGNGARWVTPSRRINLSQQTKWEYTNTVATLNLEEGSDMTIHCLNCGQNGDYRYTNVVNGVEVVSPNVMTSIVNQAGGTFRTTGYYTAGEEGRRAVSPQHGHRRTVHVQHVRRRGVHHGTGHERADERHRVRHLEHDRRRAERGHERHPQELDERPLRDPSGRRHDARDGGGRFRVSARHRPHGVARRRDVRYDERGGHAFGRPLRRGRPHEGRHGHAHALGREHLRGRDAPRRRHGRLHAGVSGRRPGAARRRDGRNVRSPSLGTVVRVRRRKGRARDGGGHARRLHLRPVEEARLLHDGVRGTSAAHAGGLGRDAACERRSMAALPRGRRQDAQVRPRRRHPDTAEISRGRHLGGDIPPALPR